MRRALRPLAHVIDRLDRGLGRLVLRVVGVVFLVPTLGAAQGLRYAVGAGDWIAVVVLSGATLAFGAAAAYCLRGHRRLSDLD